MMVACVHMRSAKAISGSRGIQVRLCRSCVCVVVSVHLKASG